METTKTTTVRVEITHDEVAGWIKEHMGELNPTDGRFYPPRGRPPSSAALDLSWCCTKDTIAAFVKSLIKDLPPAYSVQPVEGDPKIAMRVTWSA